MHHTAKKIKCWISKPQLCTGIFRHQVCIASLTRHKVCAPTAHSEENLLEL